MTSRPTLPFPGLSGGGQQGRAKPTKDMAKNHTTDSPPHPPMPSPSTRGRGLCVSRGGGRRAMGQLGWHFVSQSEGRALRCKVEINRDA